MELERRVFRVQRSQQVLIPLDAKVWMQPALHQHACAAECDCFVDLFADLVDGANVSVRRTRPAIKSAEGADYVTDICVIDIAIDDVCDHIVSMSALTNFVSGGTDPRNIVRFEQRGAIIRGEPHACEGSLQNALNLTRHVLSLLVT